MFAIGFWSNSKVSNEEDFIVGGRSFNLYFTSFALFATWFGAGTLITATDEIQKTGLQAMNLEPMGAGLCLVVAGFFFAKPLWEMKLLTIGDFFREKFGPKSEAFSVVATVPSYIGWIAVQFMALAQLLHNFFNVDLALIIGLIALLAMLLTMIGGLWSVTVTDSVQMLVIIAGLLLIFVNIVGDQNGFSVLMEGVNEELKVFFPTETFVKSLNWISVLAVAALGNLSGQDLLQRIFSAKSAKVARNGCFVAGFMYILFGSIPALLGIFSWQLLQVDPEGNVIAKLSQNFLPPWATLIFTLCVCATVFSTLTSALLAPSSVIAHNFLKARYPNVRTITLCRVAVVLMTVLSVSVSFMGEDFFGILEESYAIGLVCFFPPMIVGLFDRKRLKEDACFVSMATGLGVWSTKFVVEWNLQVEMPAVALGFAAYYGAYRLLPSSQKKLG